MLSHESIPKSHRQQQDKIAAQTAEFLESGETIKMQDEPLVREYKRLSYGSSFTVSRPSKRNSKKVQ